MKNVYEEPSEESVADKRTYQRLQREAQAREDAALTVSLASQIKAPKTVAA